MSRKITAAHKAECVRLRNQDQLSTPAIARKVGLANASVYKILRKHPWAGVTHSPREWTREEVDRLEKLYPVADDADLLAAFPRRTLSAIGRKASSLSIRRPLPGSRKNKRFIHPIFRRLRAERERQGLTRVALAKKLGYHWNEIQAWENGKRQPRFISVYEWAVSLGMELMLKGSGAATFDDRLNVPSKARMMAGR